MLCFWCIIEATHIIVISLCQNAEVTRELEQEEDIIAAVRSSIDQDITSKAAIVKLVADETGITHNKIRQVLAKRKGKDYALGHRWTVEVGKHNKSTYSILDQS